MTTSKILSDRIANRTTHNLDLPEQIYIGAEQMLSADPAVLCR